ncbi:MAG TPA: RsmE family RNA methyltransferase [Spirochaetota bacterium]|nr:RsmE family RNA methyltransferase [Spirochaetota bacterium]
MPQFFVKQQNFTDGHAYIEGDDYRHLVHVRRVKNGSTIYLSDETGTLHYGVVTEITQHQVKIRLTGSYNRSNPGLDISLYMCIIKGGNFDYAIQKSAEVGVSRIIPVISERTIPDPDKKLEQKVERWNRIAAEACKQCMRSTPVQVGLPVAFSDAVDLDNSQVKLIGHPGADRDIKEHLSSIQTFRTAGILIGPEGGFTGNELKSAGDAGWTAVNFGFTHLRAETAASVIPALVIYHRGR